MEISSMEIRKERVFENESRGKESGDGGKYKHIQRIVKHFVRERLSNNQKGNDRIWNTR
jgi:hypothetical protein